ncbi:MAG: type II toxin-antitoxin system Phd/YefM family antitoxin [Lachnospiraceae bacterium]|nr:type II toxin-antitoxin system Phd/YefM family antitoxin [Lachnospiraceae bacterium]
MEKVYGSSFRANLKEYMNKAEKEPLLIERRDAENLVLLSENEYERLVNWMNNNQMLSLEIEQKVDAVLSRRLMDYEKLLREKEK